MRKWGPIALASATALTVSACGGGSAPGRDGNRLRARAHACACADARRNPGRTRLAAGTRHETDRSIERLDGNCADPAGAGRTARPARAGRRAAGRGDDWPDGAARACRSCARVSESQRRPQDVRSTFCAGFATSAWIPRARNASDSPLAPSVSPCTRYVCGLPPTPACQRNRSS